MHNQLIYIAFITQLSSVKVGVVHNDQLLDFSTIAYYAGCINLIVSRPVSITHSHFHLYQYTLHSEGQGTNFMHALNI